jgi:glutamate dehydrogenase (NADP+)
MAHAELGAFLQRVADRNPGQPEFLQVVEEMMYCLCPFTGRLLPLPIKACWSTW